MTDRGWTARQPDGTPVEQLPLRPGTIRTLRAGRVLTLGQLRAMRDRELTTLRHFGRAALADVRSLLPPLDRVAEQFAKFANEDGEVTIAGRVFTLGAVYAPRSGRGRKGGRKPRRLLGYAPGGASPGGAVTVEMVPVGAPYVMAGEVWAAWAGEPVEDAGR